MRKAFTIFALLASTTLAGVVNYTYDAAGRLTKVDYGSGGSIVYEYDKAGNLTKRVVTAPASGAMKAEAARKPEAAKPEESRGREVAESGKN